MQEIWQRGGRIMASSPISIKYLPSGTVNSRKDLRLKVLDHIFLPLGLLQTLFKPCGTSLGVL